MRLHVGAMVLLGFFSLPVLADPVSVVGIPVMDGTSTTQVGLVAPDGTVTMYIPLTPPGGIYGVDDSGDFGTTADSVTGPYLGGGMMDMWWHFALNASPNSSAMLTFKFSDLDLFGASDPGPGAIPDLVQFLESVDIYDSGGALLASIDSITDPGVSGTSGDQTLVLDMTALGIPVGENFWARSRYFTHIDYQGASTLTNTSETVKTTMVTVPSIGSTSAPVPEPTTLFLFGSGLLAGAVRLRKRFEYSVTAPTPDRGHLARLSNRIRAAGRIG